jgi:DNA-binding NarL/FixJ family response regulator
MAIRALVCDDTEDMRILLKSALAAFGDFEVVGSASNGRDAVAQSKELQPDVVLLDLGMPLMDGMQALPAIRAAAPSARIVVLSGFDANGRDETVRRLGGDGYIVKGMNPRAMTEEIERLVRQPRAEAPHGGSEDLAQGA